MEATENEDGDFEVDTLSGPQPVELPPKRCDVAGTDHDFCTVYTCPTCLIYLLVDLSL